MGVHQRCQGTEEQTFFEKPGASGSVDGAVDCYKNMNMCETDIAMSRRRRAHLLPLLCGGKGGCVGRSAQWLCSRKGSRLNETDAPRRVRLAALTMQSTSRFVMSP